MSQDAPLHVDPQLSVPSPQQTNAPSYRLFSPGQILAASLLGSIVAGSLLFAINERRLGRARMAWLSVAISIAAVVALVFAADKLGGGGHRLGWLGHVLGFPMWDLAKRGQGAEYKAHLAAGRKRGSTGVVALITLASVAVIFANAAIFSKPYGEQLKVGGNTVYYKAGVSREEAQKVADALFKDHYFDDSHSRDVQLRREGKDLTLVLATRSPNLTPSLLRLYQDMADQLDELIAPLHVSLVVTDVALETETRVPRLPRIDVDKVRVYLLDGATAEEAHRLIDALVKADVLDTAKAYSYELRRDGDGYIVSTILNEGMWDDAKIVAAYAKLAKIVSLTVFGGKPVHYRLCDDGFDVKRTVP